MAKQATIYRVYLRNQIQVPNSAMPTALIGVSQFDSELEWVATGVWFAQATSKKRTFVPWSTVISIREL